MPSTAEQVKSVISKHKGGIRKQQIARELKIGLDYVSLISRELERRGEIIFSGGFYSVIAIDKKSKNRIKSSTSVLLSIPKMTKELIQILENAGYKTIESLADAPISRLMQETKLKLHEAAGLINQARKALNKNEN